MARSRPCRCRLAGVLEMTEDQGQAAGSSMMTRRTLGIHLK